MTLTDDMALRLFFLPVMAGCIAYQVYCADERDRITVLDNKQPRYQPFYWLTNLLPFIMAFYVVRELLWPSSRCPLQKSVFSCAVVFLSATLYDSVLLLLLPWLRRRINARTCGILWTMPGFLYLTLYSWFQLDRPALILRPPVRLLSLFLPVWMTGSVLVLLWAVIQHLRFRRTVLRESVPEQNPEILSLWHEEQALAGFQETPFLLVRSPAVRTPLSIGLLRKTTQVVLPERHYNHEELHLVFRHEIVHISRQDPGIKLFLTVCTALFWFNPLMWLARNRSAEDLELSCDETVLLNADQATRRRYAELLLTTAGEQRGFTTCLSASAKSLRYRLQNVMRPAKRHLGVLTAAAAFLVLTLPFGLVTFAWTQSTLGDWVLPGDPTAYTVTSVALFEADNSHTPCEVTDPQALLKLLDEVAVEELAGDYTFSSGDSQSLYVHYSLAGVGSYLALSEDTVTLYPHADYSARRSYHLPQPPDWEAISALLIPAA